MPETPGHGSEVMEMESPVTPIPIDFGRGARDHPVASGRTREASVPNPGAESPSVLFDKGDDSKSVFDPASPSFGSRRGGDSSSSRSSSLELEHSSFLLDASADIEANTIAAGAYHRRCQRCLKVVPRSRALSHLKSHRINNNGCVVARDRRCKRCDKLGINCIVARHPGAENINTLCCLGCMMHGKRCSMVPQRATAAAQVASPEAIHPALLTLSR
ncbi:hypothetical protein JDV02_008642 [Purpureocillium takamizusanense]|uniref:Uncharacterized protein n=1 Tax=Purpureocillium takamizusanense TaxID=2060973 RepID=A0A9Q8QQ32_9HYPO|nr:uncharacterized protein JDV02_008642 [Purpureocillium takamizusanense]UNI22786.1 hypothetical protein JDV02_008642 [Purpureocillium takamizusanense]